MEKIILAVLLGLFSTASWGECELQYKTPVDVAECYVKESEAQVKTKFNELKKLTSNHAIYSKSATTELLDSQNKFEAYKASYCNAHFNYDERINSRANCIVTLNNYRVEQLQSDIDSN